MNSDASITKTSLEKQWGKPSVLQYSKNKYCKGVRISKQFPEAVPLPDIVPFDFGVGDLPVNCILTKCMKMTEEKQTEHFMRSLVYECLERAFIKYDERNIELGVTQFLLFSQQQGIYTNHISFSSHECRDFYTNEICITEAEVFEICKKTSGQATNPQWFEARKKRISASKYPHMIKGRKTRTIESIVNDILSNKSPIQNPAMIYGQKFECVAIEKYEKLLGVQVYKVGLLVSLLQPWLCCSLDGFVVEDGAVTKIVEVKCPFSCKISGIVNSTDGKINVPYLELVPGSESQLRVKRSHTYYTQCQLQMYVSGVPQCDLFVWSESNSVVVNIPKDESFLQDVVQKLEFFYFNHLLSPLVELEKTKKSTH